MHLVGDVQRRGRARVQRAAGVDDDEVVDAPQRLDGLLHLGRIGRSGPAVIGRAGQHVDAAVVARQQVRHRAWIDPVELVEQVQQRELRSHAEEECDVARPWFEIDDDGRRTGDAAKLSGTVHRERRRPRAALRPQERDHHAGDRGNGYATSVAPRIVAGHWEFAQPCNCRTPARRPAGFRSVMPKTISVPSRTDAPCRLATRSAGFGPSLPALRITWTRHGPC